MSPRTQDAHRSDRGAAAVEFALVCVLLLMLVVGVVEIGRLYGAQLAVTHAAREGARAAAVGRYNSSYVEEQAAPLSASLLSVSESEGTDSNGDRFVQVSVSYPVTIAFLGTTWTRTPMTVTVRSSARMRAEF